MSVTEFVQGRSSPWSVVGTAPSGPWRVRLPQVFCQCGRHCGLTDSPHTVGSALSPDTREALRGIHATPTRSDPSFNLRTSPSYRAWF